MKLQDLTALKNQISQQEISDQESSPEVQLPEKPLEKGDAVWLVQYSETSRFLESGEVPEGTKHNMGSFYKLNFLTEATIAAHIETPFATVWRYSVATESRYHQAHFRSESEAREFVESFDKIHKTWRHEGTDRFGESGFGRFNDNR